MIKDKRYPELCLLPSAQTRDKDAVTPEQMVALINELREEFDYILLDCPAGIEQGFKNACAGADSAIIVTTPEVSAIRDADRVIGLLAARSIDPQLIVNRVDFDMVRRGDMLSIDDVQDILGIELIGVIERDERIIVAANCGEPVVYNPKSKAGQAYSRIAGRMCGEKIPIPMVGGTRIWNRIGRLWA